MKSKINLFFLILLLVSCGTKEYHTHINKDHTENLKIDDLCNKSFKHTYHKLQRVSYIFNYSYDNYSISKTKELVSDLEKAIFEMGTFYNIECNLVDEKGKVIKVSGKEEFRKAKQIRERLPKE